MHREVHCFEEASGSKSYVHGHEVRLGSFSQSLQRRRGNAWNQFRQENRMRQLSGDPMPQLVTQLTVLPRLSPPSWVLLRAARSTSVVISLRCLPCLTRQLFFRTTCLRRPLRVAASLATMTRTGSAAATQADQTSLSERKSRLWRFDGLSFWFAFKEVDQWATFCFV